MALTKADDHLRIAYEALGLAGKSPAEKFGATYKILGQLLTQSVFGR